MTLALMNKPVSGNPELLDSSMMAIQAPMINPSIKRSTIFPG